MIDPIRPAGPAIPVAPKRVQPPVSGPSFAERLGAGLARDPAAPAPADPRLEQVQRFASESLGTEAWEARLLERYDALSADEGLYEVQTSQGPYQIIRSRMGTLSIYAAP